MRDKKNKKSKNKWNILAYKMYMKESSYKTKLKVTTLGFTTAPQVEIIDSHGTTNILSI
jgi:hypothetical protein